MPGQSIYHFDQRDTQRILAWARYVFWADVECKQYDAYERPNDEPSTGLSTVLMVQYLAALWVAIEGWRQCPLTDPMVDELLTHPAFERNLQLLRRFRNGVYHYQKDLINERLLAFLKEGERTIPWAFLVHYEFRRVLWELACPQSLPPDLQEELTAILRQVIGWLPSDIIEAYDHHAARRHREVAEMILKHSSGDTPEATDLLAAAEQLRSAAHQAEAEWT